jgi:peptidoglycan/xylan/chitin deacetylase (PgdA/CDA1 family)
VSAGSDLYRSVRSRIAPATKSLLFESGALSAFRSIRPSDRLAILRYHAICGPEGYAYASPGICISPGAFESHVRYLAANYQVLALPDAVAAIRDHQGLPRNAVAITFDDGYIDNLAAARVLARHGLTATFYITAGCLAGGQPFWPSELRYLLSGIRTDRVRLTEADVDVDLNLSTTMARRSAVHRLTKVFKAHPIPVREALRAQLRGAAEGVEMPRVMLTWEEVREMRRLGMTIGSHTMTHPNLPNAGLAAARAELVAARQRLESETDSEVTMFSYPNGGAERYMTPEVRQLVCDAGYAGATTSRNAFAGPQSDVYALERVEVEESLADLVFALEVERFAFKPQARLGEGQ